MVRRIGINTKFHAFLLHIAEGRRKKKEGKILYEIQKIGGCTLWNDIAKN
ncbi:MAG: hypothetical protein SWX82_33070 [Cyanobacteriota bacterium]|nr:hypothetical protein [Cyanobacteriota bacterium]